MTINSHPLPNLRGAKPHHNTGRPQSEKQAQASKRNFALFVLRGMVSQLHHLLPVLPLELTTALHTALTNCTTEIERNPHVTPEE